MMSFIHRLVGGKGAEGPGTEAGGEARDGKPVWITSGREDSLPDHIEGVLASGALPPDRSYRALFLYAIRVSGTRSCLSHFPSVLQGAVRAAATGDFQGTVLELKPEYGRPLPRKMLVRILGVASYEGKKGEADLVTCTPGPQGPQFIIALVLRGDPALPEGVMEADPGMAEGLRAVLGGGGRLPSESAQETISRMCKTDVTLAHLPRFVGMISEILRKEGIPEPNILDFTRTYLSGTCPSCHRPYSGEEIVLLCGQKQSRKVQETRQWSRNTVVQRVPGGEQDLYWRLNRLNRGLCLNPSCNSGIIDLSWVPSSPP